MFSILDSTNEVIRLPLIKFNLGWDYLVFIKLLINLFNMTIDYVEVKHDQSIDFDYRIKKLKEFK